VVDVRWWLSMVADVAVTVAVSRTTEAQAVDVRGLVRWSGCRTVQDGAGLEDKTYFFRMDAALRWLTAGRAS
jgi:hypothetical protein